MSPASVSPTRLTLLTLVSATTLFLFYKSRRRLLHRLKTFKTLNPKPKGKIFFISQTSTSKTLARRLHRLLTLNHLLFDLLDPKDYEPEDLCKETVVLFIASTWESGGAPENGAFLVNWVNESAEDFRVGSDLLSNCRFAVFGVGSRVYGESFNAVGKGLSEKLRKLGGNEVLEMCEGDVDEGNLDEVFDGWSKKLVEVLKVKTLKENGGGFYGNFDGGVGGEESDDDDVEEDVEELEIVDLEDIAGKAPSRRKEVAGDVKVNGELNGEMVVNGKKAMVTPVIRANLEKQVVI